MFYCGQENFSQNLNMAKSQEYNAEIAPLVALAAKSLLAPVAKQAGKAVMNTAKEMGKEALKAGAEAVKESAVDMAKNAMQTMQQPGTMQNMMQVAQNAARQFGNQGYAPPPQGYPPQYPPQGYPQQGYPPQGYAPPPPPPQPPQQPQAAPAAYYDESDSEVEDEDGYDGHGPIEWAVKKWAMHKAKKQFQA